MERSPCCTTNAGGSVSGDPLNLVIVGYENAAAISPVILTSLTECT
jgi:hypothetical protein